MVGQQYEWHIRHPGPDERLDTADDVVSRRDLHVPVARAIEIELQSKDYIYGFRIPELWVNEMAVPDVPFQAAFYPAVKGTHDLKGDQMCGYRHKSLLGKVVVHSQRGYRAWIRRQRSQEE